MVSEVWGDHIEACRNHDGVAQRAIEEKLKAALAPFVTAYLKHEDPIGDSDLYNEQPRSVHVTLGDCRTAARVMREVCKLPPE
jgi:hypothetical protein